MRPGQWHYFVIFLIATVSPLSPASSSDSDVLTYKEIKPGHAVKPGTELRILCVGDSITSGWLSNEDGGDGNGYRLQLRDDLSKDKVVFAGTETDGTMTDGYFAAWPGQTVDFIGKHSNSSLEQRPNIILLHAGTNDMDSQSDLSKQGDDPVGVARRLGQLIDQMIAICPDAAILVAVIIGTCDPHRAPRTPEYQALIPGIVQTRREAGHHVLAVDFSHFPISDLRDCVHPTNAAYHTMGDYWYDFVTQIPSSWINEPVGPGPKRDDSGGSAVRFSKYLPYAGLGLLLYLSYYVI